MNKQKGFTLMELMISIAIVAILLSIAIPTIKRMGMTDFEKAQYDAKHRVKERSEYQTFCVNGQSYVMQPTSPQAIQLTDANGIGVPCQ